MPASKYPTGPAAAATGCTARMRVPALVGRCEELHELLGTVPRRPSVALVEGEAGIGKTRLVRELLEQPEIADHAVLTGHCHPLREPFPYGPVLELLRGVERYCPAPTKLNPVIGALRPYLPELRDQLPAALDPLADPRAERHQLFRAVRELLAAVGPAVLVVEDLHWADDGSRDLLRFLVEQPPEQLAVVLTYRREDLPGAGLPLGQAYRHPCGVASALVQLSPLGSSAVRALAAEVLDCATVPAELVTRLHERTAGIPFVVEEVVRALSVSKEALARGDRGILENIEVPLLLREAMSERMVGLSAAAVKMVRAAAVLRIPAAEDLLAAVAGVDPDEAVSGLTAALRAGVLHESDGQRYGFRHALAQQALYDRIPGPERRASHRAAMRGLSTVDPAPLVQLAHHARQAGETGEWLRYSEAAADTADEVGDTASAVDVLEGVLSEPTLPKEARGRLAVKLSRVVVIGLSHRRSVRLLRRVLHADDLPVGVRGEVRLNLGLLLTNQAGEVKAGFADTETAVGELGDRPALAARGMAALALPTVEGPTLAAHEAWMKRAERMVTHQDDPVAATAVLANRVALLMDAGDPAAWSEVERLPGRTCSVAERQQVARGYGNVADACTWLGHYAAAERFLAEAVRWANDSGTPLADGLVGSTQLRLDWALGRWNGLDERARQLLESTPDTPLITGDACLVLGQLAVARGEWKQAYQQLTAAGLSDPDNAAAPVNAAASGSMVRILLARGEVAAACAEVDRAVGRLRSKGIWTWAGELAPSAVAALTRDGRSVHAEQLIAELRDGVEGREAPLARAALDACRGIVAEAQRRHAEAAHAFSRAHAGYERLLRPYSMARAGEAAVRSRLAMGEARAAGELSELTDHFTALGATRDAARCRRALRHHGVVTRSRQGRKGYGEALSPREREVARLLALSHTNREIAEVMFLSPRTVEQHVAKVLRKLRVSSRDAVAEVPLTQG